MAFLLITVAGCSRAAAPSPTSLPVSSREWVVPALGEQEVDVAVSGEVQLGMTEKEVVSRLDAAGRLLILYETHTDAGHQTIRVVTYTLTRGRGKNTVWFVYANDQLEKVVPWVAAPRNYPPGHKGPGIVDPWALGVIPEFIRTSVGGLGIPVPLLGELVEEPAPPSYAPGLTRVARSLGVIQDQAQTSAARKSEYEAARPLRNAVDPQRLKWGQLLAAETLPESWVERRALGDGQVAWRIEPPSQGASGILPIVVVTDPQGRVTLVYGHGTLPAW